MTLVKVHTIYYHDIAKRLGWTVDENPKEYCMCDACIKIRARRDRIYKKKLKKKFKNLKTKGGYVLN